MAFPTLPAIIIDVAVFVIGAPIVYLLSKGLKFRPKPIQITEPKKEATLALVVTAALFVLVFAWRTSINTFQLQPPNFTGSVTLFLLYAFLYGIGLVVVAVAMRSTRQKFGSIGISKKDGWKNLLLGFTFSAIFLAVAGVLALSSGGGFAGLSNFLVYDLILSVVVGFGEEILWRGYVQTRLIAYGGTIKGLVVTSLLFAVLWHFPVAYYVETSGVVLEALASALTRFPIGLLMGYMMLKSQNVIPCSIYHAFNNWSTTLWRLALS